MKTETKTLIKTLKSLEELKLSLPKNILRPQKCCCSWFRWREGRYLHCLQSSILNLVNGVDGAELEDKGKRLWWCRLRGNDGVDGEGDSR